MRIRSVTVIAVLLLFTGACAGDDTDAGGETTSPAGTGTPALTETPGDATEAPGGATVAVASSDLGDILVDGEGRTLYLFMPDEQGTPTCTEGCAATWPPFEGPAGAGEGTDAALLDTVDHPSGVTQVIYNDWPLYHFANDEAPGDTNGQGVGGNWYVVGPDGEAITAEA